MKRKLWRLIWFTITVTFPILILTVLLLILLFNNIDQRGITQKIVGAYSIVNPILSLFYLPYVYLSYAAFAHSLLRPKP